MTPLIDAILSVDTNVFQELDAQKSLDSMCQHSCRVFALSANDDNKLLIKGQWFAPIGKVFAGTQLAHTVAQLALWPI